MGVRWSVLVLAGMGAIAAGCSRGEARVPEAARADSALLIEEAAPVEARDLPKILQAAAPLEAASEALVVARVAGEITAIEVEEGAAVTAGQVLARLDGERLRLRMMKARAELDRANGEYDRLARLREQGLVSAAAFEELGFERAALEAAWELHRLDHGHATVRAPVSGVVALRHVKLGEQVGVGEALFSITDTSRLVAYLHLPQTELARVGTSDTADFRVDSLPDARFEAAIARISPTVDARTGTFRATLDIDNAAGLLAPGMFSRFDLRLESRADSRRPAP